MKKTLTLAVMVAAIIGCVLFTTAANASAETINLKFATGFSPKHTMQVKVFEPWAKKITEMTKGKVKITFFPGGALGKAPAVYSITEKGIADIGYSLQDYTPGRFPVTTVFELPFVITSATQTSRAMWKVYEQFPAFQKEYGKVKLLALFCHPSGNFNTTKKPIKTVDDLKGMKFRTASPHVTQALNKFGAVPVHMPITEAYMSLERGVIEGTVLPWEGNFIFKLADLLKYGTETKFYTMAMMVVMNKKKWDSLPADVKKVFEKTTGLAMSVEAGRVYDDTNAPMRDLCVKKGMQVIQLPEKEKEKLRNLSEPIRSAWVKEMTQKGYPAQAILDAAIKYTKE